MEDRTLEFTLDRDFLEKPDIEYIRVNGRDFERKSVNFSFVFKLLKIDTEKISDNKRIEFEKISSKEEGEVENQAVCKENIDECDTSFIAQKYSDHTQSISWNMLN